MQKWEYLRVNIDNLDRVQTLNGRTFNGMMPDLDSCLASFGEQGWELVTTRLAGSHIGGYEWVFKRPKSQ